MPYANWATKERLPLIGPAFEPDLYRAIVAKAQKLDGFIHAIGGTQDHVHLAASIPPKLVPALFMGEIKGNASHFINHVVKPNLAFYWQDEYGVLTFGEKNLRLWYAISTIRKSITQTGQLCQRWRLIVNSQF